MLLAARPAAWPPPTPTIRAMFPGATRCSFGSAGAPANAAALPFAQRRNWWRIVSW